MGAATLIQLCLTLLQGVLTATTSAGTTIPQDIANAIGAAIQNLESVQGSDVTYQQLEALRVKPKW